MLRTAIWTLSMLAGLLVLVLLSLFMSSVTVSYLLLVAVALVHGFSGLHSMLTEYWTGRRAGKICAGLCLTVGGGLFSLAAVTSLVA